MKTDLLKSIRNHVPDPPALVLYQVPQRCQQNTVARLLLLGHHFGDGDQDFDGEKPKNRLALMLERGSKNQLLPLLSLDRLGQDG